MSEEKLIIEDLLTKNFSPARNPLLEWLAQQVDNNMLELIAGADYGSDFEEHYRALRQIRDNLQISVPMAWPPIEVLQLTQWTRVESFSAESGITLREAHLIRAFACTVLLIAYGDPQETGLIGSEADPLIHLVESVLALGEEVIRLTLQLISWRIIDTTTVEVEDRPFFALATLLLAVALQRPPLDSVSLIQICDWVMLEESRSREELADYRQTGDTRYWLLNLTNFLQLKEVWLNLSRRLLLEPPGDHPPEVIEALRLIGTALTWR